MGPEHVLLAALLGVTVLVLVRGVRERRRRRQRPNCPHCGSRLQSIEPGRRRCDRCNLYFRRIG